MKVEIKPDEGEDVPEGKEIIPKVIDPEVQKFEAYFKSRSGGGSLTRMEREILRAFIWWKLRGTS